MKKVTFMFTIIFFSVCTHLQSQTAIINVDNRNTFSLNGRWNYIIDPYETGYYEYRYVPYDQNPNPWGGFFLDKKQRNKPAEPIEQQGLGHNAHGAWMQTHARGKPAQGQNLDNHPRPHRRHTRRGCGFRQG